MIAYLVGLALQGALILGAGLTAAVLLRRRSAALRHAALAAAVGCTLLLPVLGAVVPPWAPWALPGWPGEATGPSIVEPSSAVASDARLTARQPAAPGTATPARPMGALVSAVCAAAWAVGAATALATLGIGLVRLRRLARQSTPVSSPTWIGVERRVAEELGHPGATLLTSAQPHLLATWGWRRPCIVVPEAALNWPERDVEIVLRHEFAHLTRRDWLALMIAEVVRATQWFNPLAWMAVHQMHVASELACDDVVLRQGVTGVDYADRLVAIARTFDSRQRRASVYPAPAFTHASALERRITAMLDPRLPRSPLEPAVRTLIVALALAVALPIAGLAVTGQSPWGVVGSIVDPSNRPVPGVEVILTNTKSQAKVDVRTSRDGQFEFAALPAGTYALEARLPGFATVKGTVEVTQAGAKRDFALALGSIQESLTIRVSNDPPPAAPSPGPQAAPRSVPAAAPCTADAAIGGQVRPPRKLKDVKPTYPESLKGSKTGGLVIVEGTLNGDGTVTGMTVLEAPHPDLARAVIDAIGGWVFDGTLLNCQPVPVKMRVRATFEVR